jgi:hypothetical protein
MRSGTAHTQPAVIRPWEGEVTDAGIELGVEVSNRLQAELLRRHSDVTLDELREMNNVAWDFVNHGATPFVSEGELDLAGIGALA